MAPHRVRKMRLIASQTFRISETKTQQWRKKNSNGKKINWLVKVSVNKGYQSFGTVPCSCYRTSATGILCHGLVLLADPGIRWIGCDIGWDVFCEHVMFRRRSTPKIGAEKLPKSVAKENGGTGRPKEKKKKRERRRSWRAGNPIRPSWKVFCGKPGVGVIFFHIAFVSHEFLFPSRKISTTTYVKKVCALPRLQNWRSVQEYQPRLSKDITPANAGRLLTRSWRLLKLPLKCDLWKFQNHSPL